MSSLDFARKAAIAALELYGVEVSAEQADTVARGVLLAMREPSDVMLDAGANAGDWHDTIGWPKDDGSELEAARKVWQTMLTAALNDGV